jgi:uncharacterized protein YdeI (YjbR/CyaY-like superfamily)
LEVTVIAETREIKHFKDAATWDKWLAANHVKSRGVWLQFAKKGSAKTWVTHADALECALRWGWIDGQKDRFDEGSWLQKFGPRAPKSLWSKINRSKVEELIQAGRMMPNGLKEVERAKTDGRWDAAYDSFRAATVPPDLASRLDKLPKAKQFFESLNSRNRYSILFRIQTAKKPETRAKRIDQFVDMLVKGEKIHS